MTKVFLAWVSAGGFSHFNIGYYFDVKDAEKAIEGFKKYNPDTPCSVECIMVHGENK